jgi:cephalosporin hydroxylase
MKCLENVKLFNKQGYSMKHKARLIVKPFFEVYMYVLGSKLAARKLKYLSDSKGKDIEQIVDLAFNFEYRQKIRKSWVVNIKPLQVKTEVMEFFRIIQELKPRIIVEVGSASGGMLFLFGHITNPERMISIDLPSGSFGGGYPFWKIPLFRSFGNKRVIKLIRADSHSKETFCKLKTLLNGNEVDFLFVDGDHTYDGVKQDFQMYSSLIRKGGIVAFHDIVKHDQTTNCEVHRFWEEIKHNHNYIEIIESPSQRWAGIGVLYF